MNSDEFQDPRRRNMPREADMKEIQELLAEGAPVEVELEHYEQFLELSDEAMRSLVVALTRMQSKGFARLIAKQKTGRNRKCLAAVVEDSLFAVAVGIARSDVFGQIRFHKRVGPNPDGWTNFLIEKKIKAAAPLIEMAIDLYLVEAVSMTKNSRNSSVNQKK